MHFFAHSGQIRCNEDFISCVLSFYHVLFSRKFGKFYNFCSKMFVTIFFGPKKLEKMIILTKLIVLVNSVELSACEYEQLIQRAADFWLRKKCDPTFRNQQGSPTYLRIECWTSGRNAKIELNFHKFPNCFQLKIPF